jgi:hypothetical protein
MFFSLFPSFNYILSFNLAYIKGPKKKVDGMKEKRRKKDKRQVTHQSVPLDIQIMI